MGGMTRKMLIRTFTTSSKSPPTSAAVIPRTAAMPVARTAAKKPSSNELRAPTTTWEKMSLPWSVVPNRWSHEGAWPSASRLKAFGSSTEISGAIAAMSTAKPTIAAPRRAFGLANRSATQPGTRKPAADAFRRYLPGEVEAGPSVGSSCDIRRSAGAGRGRG